MPRLKNPSFPSPSSLFTCFFRLQFPPIRIQPQFLNLTESITTSSNTNKDEIIISPICDSLRKGENWNGLTKRFNSMKLTETIIQKVLLELKETTDAKHALSFFHWSATTTKTQHGVRSYCTIIHILVRARLLTDARALIESLIKRTDDVVQVLLSTYTDSCSIPLVFDLLIQTYAKLRMFECAFEACRCIEEHGFSSSIITFNTLLHVIQKSSGMVSLAWKVYEYMICMRKFPNEITIRIMTNALSKEGKLQKAIDVLDRIHGKRCSSPSVIVNTWLVYSVLEEGKLDEGILLLKRMLNKNIILDDVAYSLVIFAKYKGDNNLVSSKYLFGEMVERGFSANSFLYTLLIAAHCKEGRIEEAKELMQEMQVKRLKPYNETFNALIDGSIDANESLRFCEEMVNGGFLPNCSTFNKMVRKLADAGMVKKGNDLLSVLLEKGFQPSEATYSYLMDGYGKQGEIQEVLKLYYEMEYKKYSLGVMVFTSLIRSLCLCGKLSEAGSYLSVMEDRLLQPNVEIYESLVVGYYENGNMTKALQIYEKMVKRELKPSCKDFAELVKGFSDAGYLEKESRCWLLHGLILK